MIQYFKYEVFDNIHVFVLSPEMRRNFSPCSGTDTCTLHTCNHAGMADCLRIHYIGYSWPSFISILYTCLDFNSLPDDKILDWSKIETNCRRNFKVHLKWKISAM